MADVLLRLFGTPRLEAADGRVHALPNNVPGWLAAWLAVHGDWAAREAVALVFWPDRSEAAALHNLRANLHRLRAWLDGAGHGATLETDKRRVRLALASDVAAFRAACAAARWDDALAGTRAPLLQGLSLPGMAAVDAWCQSQRDSVADAARTAAQALAARWQATGRTAEAAALLMRELERDPLSEALLQALLRLAPQAGVEADALAWFDRCTRRWADELGQAPLPATAALAAALRAPGSAAVPPQATAATSAPAPSRSLLARLATPPLAGRAADLAWLQAISRQPGLVLLRGEPGVGKTRLVESALPRALWWSCWPRDGLAPPLQPVADFLQDQIGSLRDHPAVQRHRGRLARLVPELQADDQGPAAVAPDAGLQSALVEVFGALGRAIVVDDLQWADDQTLQLIGHLLEQRRLPLVATLRTNDGTEALAATLARWQAAGRVQVHELAPLSATALEQWVADLSGQPGGAPRFARWLHARSAGNPMFALETLRTLFAEGRLRADDEGWHSVLDGLADPDYDALTLPPRVAEIVRLRLVMLAPATQRVLRLCAVTGDAMWLEPLAALAQLTTPALGEALGEAQQAGVLHGRRFAHELLRQAVLEPVPEAERAALHAGWLQLAGERLTPHARAMHAWAAGNQPAAVAATLQAATFDAQRGLHAAAEARMADALRRVSGTSDDDRAARAQLLACRARVRLEAGALDSALADADAALAEDPGPETRADALAAQGDLALLQGRVADVPALAAAALEAVPGHDAALMLRVKWSHAQGDFAGAEAALRERLAGLRRAPAGAALVEVLTSLAAVIDYQGRHAEALPLHREALALARRRGLRYAEVETACNLLWCLPELGLHDEAMAVGEAAVALGEFDATPALVNNLAWQYLDQGRLDDAARLYGRLADTDDLAVRCSARAKLLQIDATAGRPVETAAQALLDAMHRTDHPQGLAIAALALLDHGPPALHAAAAALAPRVPLDPSLQSRLDAALARRGLDR